MTPKQFDICLDFHKGLIRSQHSKQTIDDARFLRDKADVSGFAAGRRSAAQSLIEALSERYLTLWEWTKADNKRKIGIYNLNNTRNPSKGAFDGAFDVMNNATGISKAAKAHNVNYQSIKVLIPRLKRWDDFAKRLHETL